MMRVSSKITFFVTFICMVFLSIPVYASVTGTVTDTSGDPVAGAMVTFIDESNPDSRISDITDDQGNYEVEIPGGTGVSLSMPSTFSLGQNYPNPFNPTTTIPFTLDVNSHVTLSIYNIMGQLISTLVNTEMGVGNHTLIWNGMDEQGNHVSAGIYLYRLQAGQYTETKKMLLLDGGGGSGVGASYVAKSAYNSGMQSVAKNADETTYTVTIIHDSIIPYEKTGVVVSDGDVLNFVVDIIAPITFVTIPAVTTPYAMNPGDFFGTQSVTLSEYQMSATEVTNAQYAQYLNEALASGDIELQLDPDQNWDVYGKTGDWSGQRYLDIGYSSDSNNKCWINYSDGSFTVESGKENWPVIAVTWYGSKSAATYYGLDLPTEAEWQYAASGGRDYEYGTDDGTISSGKANYNGNIGHPTDVGSYPANPFGLYDMTGNVGEWVNDGWGGFPKGTFHNPINNTDSSRRVTRGGSYSGTARQTRQRYSGDAADPYQVSNLYGFRVVSRYTINGIILLNGSGLTGVTVTLNGDTDDRQTVTTDDGTYLFTVSPGVNYTVTPSKEGYTFSPVSQTFSYVTSNQSLDFSASPVSIVPLTFVTIPAVTTPYLMNPGAFWGELFATLSEYHMSATEVTNSHYAQYLNEALASGDIELQLDSNQNYDVYGKTGVWSGQRYLDIGIYSEPYNNCWITYNNGTFTVVLGHENWPVVSVTWWGSKSFAAYYGLDLPTEAEWQYAASGGRNYEYGTDDGTISSGKANYNGNIGHPTDVGSYPANPFGLYDMTGNVWEWINDGWGTLPKGTFHNPINNTDSSRRVARGSSYWADALQVLERPITGTDLYNAHAGLGFRVVSR